MSKVLPLLGLTVLLQACASARQVENHPARSAVESKTAALIGKSVADLRLQDAEGRAVDLLQPGVLYLIDSWALGCSPCLWEMEDLAALESVLANEPRVRFVGVLFGWSPGKDLTRIQRQVPIAVHTDPERGLEALGCEGFPTKLLVRDGVVLDARIGAGQTGNFERLAEWLREWTPGLRLRRPQAVRGRS
jgi:thiol-disulfide isomerase/thioredoxin